MNQQTTVPSPFSYGMAYLRAKSTGLFWCEPVNQIQAKAYTVGKAPELRADVKAKLGLR